MSCNKTHVKELLNDCSCHDDDCGCGDHQPILSIASPVEGQILQYSEDFQAFINTTFINSNVLRINEVNSFEVGMPLVYVSNFWTFATPALGCDFIVVAVDPQFTWFEVAATGVFNINRPDLRGRVYLNDNSELTNEISDFGLGFAYSGQIAIILE